MRPYDLANVARVCGDLGVLVRMHGLEVLAIQVGGGGGMSE